MSAENQALRKGGVALIANGAVTGALGIIFWIVAARLFGSISVGRNSSLISAMLTISGIAQLNYTRALSSLIPRDQQHAGRMVAKVYVRVCAVSLIAGAILAGVLPNISTRFAYLRPASLAIPGFALAVGLWSVFTLEDTVLAAARRASIIPAENAAFGILKLALLFLFAAVGGGDLSIFIAWVIPLVVIVLPINLYAFRSALPELKNLPAQVVDLPGRWVRYDFAGYLFWLFGTSPLPFLVLAERGPIDAASFYIPLTVATAIDVVSLNVGNAISAEVARNPATVDRHAAQFIGAFWLLVLVGTVSLAAVAPTILTIFGNRYRAGGGTVLRVLLLGSAARSAMFLMNALARAQAKGGRILVVMAVASVLTLTIGLSTMPRIGVKGMAYGWLIGSLVAGVISLRWTVPTMRRAFQAH